MPYVANSDYSGAVQIAIDNIAAGPRSRQQMLLWAYSRIDRGDDVLVLEMSGAASYFYQFIALAWDGRHIECCATLIPDESLVYEAVDEPVFSKAEASREVLDAFRRAVAGVCDSPPLTTPPPDVLGGGEVLFRVAIAEGVACKSIDYGFFDVAGQHRPHDEGGATAEEVRAFEALLDVWRSMAGRNDESRGSVLK
jgi:hypothetical protein